MESNVIDLQEYKAELEKKELQEIEELAKQVRDAIEDLGDFDYFQDLYHSTKVPVMDEHDLLYGSTRYNYMSNFSYENPYGFHCPHCGKNSIEEKEEK